MNKKKKVFISFVGTNDAGKLINKEDGAILTTLKKIKFDEIILLWNENPDINFEEIANYIQKEILRRKYCSKVQVEKIAIKDVTDHNEIYQHLKNFTDKLPKNKFIEYYAGITSGSPAMQVCWILLAESGDFSIENSLQLLYVKNPKYGGEIIKKIKLDSYLPRIVKIKEENEQLKNLLPELRFTISDGRVFIGDEEVPLSPIEFSYYRYFAELKKNNIESVKFSGFYAPKEFLEKIFRFHEESFPDLDLNRFDLKKMLEKGESISLTTVRGNISKINKKIKTILRDENIYKYYLITIEGKRGAKLYGIKIEKDKIRII